MSDALRPAHPTALLGESEVIRQLRAEIASAARTVAKVLIVGETGVGKEVVARLIHSGSERRGRNFVAVNCSGIPETLLASELFGHTRGSFTGAYRDKVGLCRQADHGTLFLDELGEMSLGMQAAVLRFAETGELQPVGSDMPVARVDTRLIAATNRDLRAQISAGMFREDLYYRLNVIEIRVPALRDRGNDILLLLDYYLRRASEAHRRPCPLLTPDATQLLLAYTWPGNVRQLKNVTERLVLLDRDDITPADLPLELRADHDMPPARMVASPAPRSGSPEAVDRLWARLMAGEDFWTVVHQPFRAREITRTDLAALIDRGLQYTHGSYRAMLAAFHLPPTDYKRFHAFLYQQSCNLPVRPYRVGHTDRVRRYPPERLPNVS